MEFTQYLQPKFIITAVVIIAAFITWYTLRNRFGPDQQYQQELEEVLTKPEYRVKGRYD